MSEPMNTIDIPLRIVIGGVGYHNIFSPQTAANPNGWLVLRQFTRGGKWHPTTCFSLSTTYSALHWYVAAKTAIADRNAGHDGVRLVFADGSLVAEFVKFSTKKGSASNGH